MYTHCTLVDTQFIGDSFDLYPFCAFFWRFLQHVSSHLGASVAHHLATAPSSTCSVKSC